MGPRVASPRRSREGRPPLPSSVTSRPLSSHGFRRVAPLLPTPSNGHPLSRAVAHHHSLVRRRPSQRRYRSRIYLARASYRAARPSPSLSPRHGRRRSLAAGRSRSLGLAPRHPSRGCHRGSRRLDKTRPRRAARHPTRPPPSPFESRRGRRRSRRPDSNGLKPTVKMRSVYSPLMARRQPHDGASDTVPMARTEQLSPPQPANKRRR